MSEKKEQSESAEKVGDKSRFDALLEEYRQIHQDIRAERRVSQMKQSLFITISFGIIAFTIGKNLDVGDLLFSSIASIFLYFLSIVIVERSIYYNLIRYDRIRDIEGETGSFFGDSPIKFQSNLRKELNKKHLRGDRKLYFSPNLWVRFLVMRAGLREFQSAGLYLICALWLTRLI